MEDRFVISYDLADSSSIDNTKFVGVYSTIELQHGLKVDVDKNSCEKIKSEKHIVDRFDLNIKQISKNLFSIYFKIKE